MDTKQLRALLEILEGSSVPIPGSRRHPFEIGKAYFWRTVTYHLTGRVVAIDGDWLTLDDAAWIADSGRYAQTVENGTVSEVEPIGRAFLNVSCATDSFEWKGTLPKAQK